MTKLYLNNVDPKTLTAFRNRLNKKDGFNRWFRKYWIV